MHKFMIIIKIIHSRNRFVEKNRAIMIDVNPIQMINFAVEHTSKSIFSSECPSKRCEARGFGETFSPPPPCIDGLGDT